MEKLFRNGFFPVLFRNGFFPFRNGFCCSATVLPFFLPQRFYCSGTGILFRNGFLKKNCFPELFRNRKPFKKKLPFRNVPNFFNGSFCSGTNKTVPEQTNCSGTEKRVDVAVQSLGFRVWGWHREHIVVMKGDGG